MGGWGGSALTVLQLTHQSTNQPKEWFTGLKTIRRHITLRVKYHSYLMLLQWVQAGAALTMDSSQFKGKCTGTAS